MAVPVFAAVLFAAVLHATWNAIVKTGGSTLLTAVLVTASAAVIAAVALPFLSQPAPQSWAFIAASTLLQVVYFALLARAYHVADMSLAYPLMRGTPPLLVALSSATIVAEPLAPFAWAGVALICGGILGMTGAARRGPSAAGIGFALANAVVIAGYTLIDGIGVRRSGAPASYTLWIFLLTGIVLAGWALATRARLVAAYARQNWGRGLIGGAGTITSYGIALWAMTLAPVAIVAALRETSILFGTVISALILHERVGRARVAAVVLIASGAILLRLA